MRLKILSDIHKLLQAIQNIVGHIEHDSMSTKDVLAKTSSDIQSLLKHFNLL